MLVLTRRFNQSLMIGAPGKPETVVKVIIVEVRGDQVCLSFKAPEDSI